LDDLDETPKTKRSVLTSFFKGKSKSLAVAGIGIAAAATTVGFITSSIMRVSSVDPLPTASIAAPVLAPPKMVPAANGPDSGSASLALAPPSSVTSTFSQSAVSIDASRQAALTDAMKQSAIAQSTKTPQAAAQPMPPLATTTSVADGQVSDVLTTQSIPKATALTPAGGPVPLATDKIGSLALRSAAANGDPKAQFEVGMRFSEGRGIAPDMHEAAVWFERAASQSFQPAAYRLGSAYEKGLGVDRNPLEAKRWYRIAAEGGNIRAMHNLGVLYANDRDMPSALPWFQKAAEAGLKDSQFNLGIIYALGSGVKQDLAVSYKWFALGAAQGDQEAAKKRDDILGHLDRTMQASAKLAVSTWKPMPISREANEETAVWSEPAATASAQSSAAPAAPPLPNGWNKVMQAQAALQGKGLYAGKVDGELTPETKAAIRNFQKKAGLRQTGEIDPAFLNAVAAKQM
jgi:localization factor PodJL